MMELGMRTMETKMAKSDMVDLVLGMTKPLNSENLYWMYAQILPIPSVVKNPTTP